VSQTSGEAASSPQAITSRDHVGTSSSLLRVTAISAGWLVAWRSVTRLLGLVSTLVLARLLTPADFGMLAMATTFATAVETLSQLGLQDALVRHKRGEALMDTAFTLQVARAAVTGALICALAPAAARWFDEPRLVPVLLALGGSMLVAGIENIGIVEFRREMRFDRQFLLLTIPRLMQVAVTIPLALWLRSYWALLAGILVMRMARTVMSYIVHPYRPRFRLAGWRELAGFSFWTWATCVAALVWDRCDSFILGPALGPASLGVYFLALEVATLPTTELIYPAADALFAGLASAQRQGGSSIRFAPTIAVALVMTVLPLVITMSCASGYIVAALLGPEWAEAQRLTAILAWLAACSPFTFVISATLVANGMVRQNFFANVIPSAGKLVALMATISLTRRLDIIAAVILGCVAAESAVFVLLLRSTQQVGLRMFAGGFLRAMLAAAATVSVLYLAGMAWQYSSIAVLPALGHAMLTGAGSLALFTAFLLAAWQMAGRPAGPEQQALMLLTRVRAFRHPAASTPPSEEPAAAPANDPSIRHGARTAGGVHAEAASPRQ
jgi:lipopolysaccharide exporter